MIRKTVKHILSSTSMPEIHLKVLGQYFFLSLVLRNIVKYYYNLK